MDVIASAILSTLIALTIWATSKPVGHFILIHAPFSWRFRVIWRVIELDQYRLRLYSWYRADADKLNNVNNEMWVLLSPVMSKKPDLLLYGHWDCDEYGRYKKRYSGPLPHSLQSKLTDARILWCLFWHTDSQKDFNFKLRERAMQGATDKARGAHAMVTVPESPSPLL